MNNKIDKRKLIVAALPSPFYVDRFKSVGAHHDWYFYGDYKRRATWGLNANGLSVISFGKMIANIISGKYDRITINSYASFSCLIVAFVAKCIPIKIWLSLGIYEEIRRCDKKGIKKYIRSYVIEKVFNLTDEFYPCGLVAYESSKLWIDPNKSVVIKPYAFSRNRVINTHVRDGNKNDKKLRVLFSGAATPRRNPQELIRAVSLCPESIRSQIEIFISSPHDQNFQNLVSWIEENHRDIKVIYDRERKSWVEILEIYSLADLLIVPNVYSSWNMTVQESLIFGVPVVGTIETAAVREFVRNGVNGYTYKSGDIKQLSILLSTLVIDCTAVKNMKSICMAEKEYYLEECIDSKYVSKDTQVIL